MRDDANNGVRDDDFSQDDRSTADDAATPAPHRADQPPTQQVWSEGLEVHDDTRTADSQGRDVTSNAEGSDVEAHGRTVLDRSRTSETQGVDVHDTGPADPEPGQQHEP